MVYQFNCLFHHITLPPQMQLTDEHNYFHLSQPNVPKINLSCSSVIILFIKRMFWFCLPFLDSTFLSSVGLCCSCPAEMINKPPGSCLISSKKKKKQFLALMKQVSFLVGTAIIAYESSCIKKSALWLLKNWGIVNFCVSNFIEAV